MSLIRFFGYLQWLCVKLLLSLNKRLRNLGLSEPLRKVNHFISKIFQFIVLFHYNVRFHIELIPQMPYGQIKCLVFLLELEHVPDNVLTFFNSLEIWLDFGTLADVARQSLVHHSVIINSWLLSDISVITPDFKFVCSLTLGLLKWWWQYLVLLRLNIH